MFGWNECILAGDAGPTDCAGGKQRSDKPKMNMPPYYRTTTIEQQSNRSAITIMSSWDGPMNSIWLLSHESVPF